MKQIHGLRLENCLLWKNLSFAPQHGITLVSGRNRSGKSLLAHSFAAAFGFGTLPKGGQASLDIGDYTVNVKHGSTQRYSIYKGDEDLKIQTIPAATKWFARRFPSEPLFHSMVYVKGTSPNPLAYLKPAAAYVYLCDIFGISGLWEAAHKEVLKRLSSLKEDEAKLQGVVTAVSSLSRPEVPDPINEDELEKSESKAAKLFELISSQELARKQGENFQYPGSVRSKQLLISSLKETRAFFRKKQANQQEAQNGYAHKQERYNTKLALQKEIALLRKEGVADIDISKDLELVKKALLPTKLVYDEYREFDFSQYKGASSLKLEEALHAHTVALANAQDSNAHFDAHRKNCIACKQKISKEHANSVNVENKRIIASYPATISKIRAQLELAKAHEALKKVPPHFDLALALIGELTVMSKNHAPMQDLLARYEKVKDAVSPEQPTTINYSAMISNLDSQIEQLGSELVELPALIPDEELAKLKTKLDDLTKHITELRQKRTEYQTLRRLRREYNESKQSLEKEMTALKKRLRRRKALEILKEAFGKTGIPSEMLDDIRTTVTAELNANAPLLWKEPYTFDLEITPGRAKLNVTRNGVTSSLESLSGSEQRSFQLLWALSLSKLISSKARVDTIILDEVEANMDKASRKLYCQQFLPVLQQTIPKIIIVTPLDNTELPIQADVRYLVKKKSTGSILELQK